MTLYHRFCKTLKDYGKFIPVNDNIYSHIVDTKVDHYTSIFCYSEDQKNEASKIVTVEKGGKEYQRPKGVVGMIDVVTKELVFDFDSENDINSAKSDTIEAVRRLKDYGINEECIRVYFSGKKGFAIHIKTDTEFTPTEFKKVTSTISKGLDTYDSVVCNPSRVMRIPNTKHQSTNLFKTPLQIDELNLSVREIKDIAKTEYDIDTNVKIAVMPKKILDMKVIVDKKIQTNINYSDRPDMSRNPFKLTPRKNAAMQGFFLPGTRSTVLLMLASSLKNKGLTEDECYSILKATIRAQSTRFNQEIYSKEEFYDTIVSQVYSTTWNGGTFTDDTMPRPLQEYYNELGVAKFDPNSDMDNSEDLVVGIGEQFENFNKYAFNIDENTMKTSITSLDAKLKMQKGQLIGLLSPPGVGKCHKANTPILMYDGQIKLVQDVKVGDLLMGGDSTPRTVLSLARGEEEMFDVIPKKGMTHGFNRSHILSLRCSETIDDNYSKDSIHNISINDYIELSDSIKDKLKLYRTGVEFKHTDTQLSPYNVGTGIAAGNLESNIDGYKCIPELYKINSREVRLELLAGLIDIGGYQHNNTFEILTKHRELSDDIVYLCRSLGLAAYCKYGHDELGKFDSIKRYNIITISGNIEMIPVRFGRKDALTKDSNENELNIGFTLESTGNGKYYGFELDGDHLYCLGDFTVTHNTSFALSVLTNTSMRNINSYFASYDMSSNVLLQKLIQRETGLQREELYDVYRNNDTDKINEFKAILEDNYKNVTFSFKTGDSIEGIKRSIKMKEEKLGKSIDLVIIDYLDLVHTKATDSTQASKEAVHGLRELANSGKLVIVLLQPNKMSSKVDEPLLSYNAAKGSSAIAEACTVVITAHRPGMSSEHPDGDNYFSINVVKNRLGGLFRLDFHWVGLTGTIRELEDTEIQDLQALRALKKLAKETDTGNDF